MSSKKLKERVESLAKPTDKEQDLKFNHKQFSFLFKNRLYEAKLHYNTVSITNLVSFVTSVSPYTWSDLDLQTLHLYLQNEWGTLPIHDYEDIELTIFDVDTFHQFKPLTNVNNYFLFNEIQ